MKERAIVANHKFNRITNIGLETFPQDIPEFKRESCEGGWNYFINRLHSYLNSQ